MFGSGVAPKWFVAWVSMCSTVVSGASVASYGPSLPDAKVTVTLILVVVVVAMGFLLCFIGHSFNSEWRLELRFAGV
jgi:hypothetical protein